MLKKKDFHNTERGFARCDFEDSNGDACSVQESSAVEPRLWLGQTTGNHCMGNCLSRMHLDQKTAAKLVKILASFAKHGDLREYDPEMKATRRST